MVSFSPGRGLNTPKGRIYPRENSKKLKRARQIEGALEFVLENPETRKEHLENVRILIEAYEHDFHGNLSEMNASVLRALREAIEKEDFATLRDFLNTKTCNLKYDHVYGE